MTIAHQAPLWNFPGKNPGVGCQALLQGTFPTQGSNRGLLLRQMDSFPLSHQGSPESWLVVWWLSLQVVSDSCDPMDCSLSGSSVHGIPPSRILEWVAISFSRGTTPSRNQTQVSCIAGRFTNWAMRESWLGIVKWNIWGGDMSRSGGASIAGRGTEKAWGERKEKLWHFEELIRTHYCFIIEQEGKH